MKLYQTCADCFDDAKMYPVQLLADDHFATFHLPAGTQDIGVYTRRYLRGIEHNFILSGLFILVC